MAEPGEIRIRIKPVKTKTEKGKLPAKIGPGYPSTLLVVYATAAVLDSLRRYAASDLDYELGGVLVGRVGKSSRRLYIVIENFIAARKGISRRASFEFTNEAQQGVHEILQSEFKDLKIIGWFHTHPGYGIFLSGADQFIDQNYFNQKYHVAVVLDPTKKEVDLGVFVWDCEKNRVRVPVFEMQEEPQRHKDTK